MGDASRWARNSRKVAAKHRREMNELSKLFKTVTKPLRKELMKANSNTNSNLSHIPTLTADITLDARNYDLLIKNPSMNYTEGKYTIWYANGQFYVKGLPFGTLITVTRGEKDILGDNKARSRELGKYIVDTRIEVLEITIPYEYALKLKERKLDVVNINHEYRVIYKNGEYQLEELNIDKKHPRYTITTGKKILIKKIIVE